MENCITLITSSGKARFYKMKMRATTKATKYTKSKKEFIEKN